MSTQGPLGPGFNANAIAPPGTLDWTLDGTHNLVALDAQEANVSMAANDVTHYLYADQFGFTIPGTATVIGVLVGWYLHASMGTIDYYGVRLFSGSNLFGGGARYSATDHGTGVAGSGSTWPTGGSPTLVNFGGTGGSADLWGEALTPTIVNDSLFGAALSATASGLDFAFVDYVEITVEYVPSLGAPPATQTRICRQLDRPTDPQFLE